MAAVVQLPPELQNNPTYLNLIKQGVTEWSQLVSWTWSSQLAFDSQPEQEQERLLKNFLIQTLKNQATWRYAGQYGLSDEINRANQASLDIKKLLIGDNDNIPSWQNPAKVTIPQVYEKLVGRQPESLSNPNFMDWFHVEVITDRFVGHIREITADEKQAILHTFAHNPDDQRYIEPLKYVIDMAYPPRPDLGPHTVTEAQLIDWMTNREGYLPPSPYIPVCAT